jgi:predicted GNAT family acetyltransferase
MVRLFARSICTVLKKADEQKTGATWYRDTFTKRICSWMFLFKLLYETARYTQPLAQLINREENGNMETIYEEGRIHIEEDGKILAEIDFPVLDAKTVGITHTFVDDSLRGQGIAGKLIQEAITIIQKTDRKIIPTCSYAVAWFEKHSEYAGLLK